jgi:hypothetical protein
VESFRRESPGFLLFCVPKFQFMWWGLFLLRWDLSFYDTWISFSEMLLVTSSFVFFFFRSACLVKLRFLLLNLGSLGID